MCTCRAQMDLWGPLGGGVADYLIKLTYSIAVLHSIICCVVGWHSSGPLHYSGVHDGPHMFMLFVHTTKPSTDSSPAILYSSFNCNPFSKWPSQIHLRHKRGGGQVHIILPSYILTNTNSSWWVPNGSNLLCLWNATGSLLKFKLGI